MLLKPLKIAAKNSSKTLWNIKSKARVHRPTLRRITNKYSIRIIYNRLNPLDGKHRRRYLGWVVSLMILYISKVKWIVPCINRSIHMWSTRYRDVLIKIEWQETLHALKGLKLMNGPQIRKLILWLLMIRWIGIQNKTQCWGKLKWHYRQYLFDEVPTLMWATDTGITISPKVITGILLWVGRCLLKKPVSLIYYGTIMINLKLKGQTIKS